MVADFRRIALSAAIAIVATILVAMSARAIFPGPHNADRPKCEERLYVPEEKERLTGSDREACEAEVKAFEKRDQAAAKNQFFVLMAASILLLGIGTILYTVPVISSGILWGGVVSLFYSLAFSFRPGLEDYLRLLAAVVAFVVLIILAYRLFGKERIGK